VFLLFRGLMLSSLVDFGIPFGIASGLLSDDWERFRAFWADPRMPSRLKLGVRAALSEFGDFSVFAPFGAAASWGEGISTEKSRLGSGNCLATLAAADVVMVAVAECGESPLEDGDMLCCAGCGNVVWASKGVRFLLPLQSTSSQQRGLSSTDPVAGSDAANTESTMIRSALSNSHYRSATSRTRKPVSSYWAA
jgi:hypothetical protein